MQSAIVCGTLHTHSAIAPSSLPSPTGFLCLQTYQVRPNLHSVEAACTDPTPPSLPSAVWTSDDLCALMPSFAPRVWAQAFKKHRFYLFSKRDPTEDTGEGRDVFNEKPPKDESMVVVQVIPVPLPSPAFPLSLPVFHPILLCQRRHHVATCSPSWRVQVAGGRHACVAKPVLLVQWPLRGWIPSSLVLRDVAG